MNIVYFLLISLFWGGSFLGINLSLRGYSPFLAATLRISIATVLSFTYIIWKKSKPPEKKIGLQAFFNGVIGLGIPWALLFWGEQHVAPALCSIINSTAPIFTAISAAIIVKSKQEKLTWNKWTGVTLGFIGIAIIFGPFITGSSLTNVWGLLAIVAMSLCYGISIAWLKNFADKISIPMVMFLECSGGLAVLIPLSIIYGITNYSLTGESLVVPTLAVLYLGVFSTTIAFMLFYKLIRSIGSVQVAAVTYVAPIISILLDWLILDKWIGSQALFGALFIFAALRLINRPRSIPAYNN